MGLFSRQPVACGGCGTSLGAQFIELDGFRFHGNLCFRRYAKTSRRKKLEERRKEKNCGGCGTCGS